MAELLFEIGTEELPPGLIQSLTEQIKVNLLIKIYPKPTKPLLNLATPQTLMILKAKS